MNNPTPATARSRFWPVAGFVLARLILGGWFIYMGLVKVWDPVAFLKLVREYDLTQIPVLLNSIAALLPWMEVFCGLLLLGGIAVRGTAWVVTGMLVPFTVVVFLRAWALHESLAIPFCAVKFDCGCGTGEILICRKLVENALLLGLALWLIWRPGKPIRNRG
ncbi:MAG: DoxX family protein [Verrucomicrobia bacterium]|jgi:uncharacterized membrane protein YphA (DoxX/SURF4 family)|nr:DoxX family protein [Verrucomicrobiota bacterium]